MRPRLPSVHTKRMPAHSRRSQALLTGAIAAEALDDAPGASHRRLRPRARPARLRRDSRHGRASSVAPQLRVMGHAWLQVTVLSAVVLPPCWAFSVRQPMEKNDEEVRVVGIAGTGARRLRHRTLARWRLAPLPLRILTLGREVYGGRARLRWVANDPPAPSPPSSFTTPERPIRQIVPRRVGTGHHPSWL